MTAKSGAGEMRLPPKPYLYGAGATVVAAGALAAAITLYNGANAPTPQQGAGSNGNSQQAADTTTPACDPNDNAPIDPVQLVGKWTDAQTGKDIEIIQDDPRNTTNFTFKADHQWQGQFKDGKLTFTRKPTADEMSHDAPDWARKIVEGSLEWSIEFAHGLSCATPTLKGTWYPGLIKIEENTGTTTGQTTSRGSASVAGKGDPIAVEYMAPPPPRFFLFAHTATGRQFIEEFYVGVPTEVELQFDKPYSENTYPVELSVGDQKLSLVANKVDQKGYIYRTDAFVPRPAAPDKGSVFVPPNPPRTVH